MLKIVIKDPSIETRTLKGQRGEFDVREQTGWIDMPSGERRRLRISLERGVNGYAPGSYTLDEASFEVSEYGDLKLSRQMKLTAVAAAAGVVGRSA